MKGFIKLLQLNFLPSSADLGLLVLRLWLGLSLLILHGWAKLTGFSGMAGKFPDPLGVGSTASLGLAVFAEVVCAALLALGLFTRFAAVGLIITMAVAFFAVHKGSLRPGPGSGEMAYIYLAGFVTLFLAGAGRFSFDRRLSRTPEPRKQYATP
jgi:putative oxidoreductase